MLRSASLEIPPHKSGAISNTDPQPTLERSQVSGKLKDSAQAQIVPVTQFEVGDRVRFLRHHHGKDDWSGKSARISTINQNGWLQVDVEGHEGVRFTLHPDWVEHMLEQPHKGPSEQPEPVIPQSWVDEPDPESLAITDISFVPQMKALPRFQAGDRLYINHLHKQDNGWVAEITEVIEVVDDYVKVIVEIPRQSS